MNCSVCHEVLSSYSDCKVQPSGDGAEEDGKGNNDHIVSTECGHLYHQKCINDWLTHGHSSEVATCPYCKSPTDSGNWRRIYPVGYEDQEWKIALDEAEAKLEHSAVAADVMKIDLMTLSEEMRKLESEAKKMKGILGTVLEIKPHILEMVASELNPDVRACLVKKYDDVFAKLSDLHLDEAEVLGQVVETEQQTSISVPISTAGNKEEVEPVYSFLDAAKRNLELE